jgi:hypothetical protein
MSISAIKKPSLSPLKNKETSEPSTPAKMVSPGREKELKLDKSNSSLRPKESSSPKKTGKKSRNDLSKVATS